MGTAGHRRSVSRGVGRQLVVGDTGHQIGQNQPVAQGRNVGPSAVANSDDQGGVALPGAWLVAEQFGTEINHHLSAATTDTEDFGVAVMPFPSESSKKP